MLVTDDPIAIGLLIGIAVLFYSQVYWKLQRNKSYGGKWYRDGGGFHSDE